MLVRTERDGRVMTVTLDNPPRQFLARRSRRAVWASKRVVYRGLSSRWPGGFQLDRTGFLWGAVAPSTERAMHAMLEQIDSAPLDVPSPWHHPDRPRQWQEGTVAAFSGGHQ